MRLVRLFASVVLGILVSGQVAALEAVAQSDVGGGSAMAGAFEAINSRADALQANQTATNIVVTQQKTLISATTDELNHFRDCAGHNPPAIWNGTRCIDIVVADGRDGEGGSTGLPACTDKQFLSSTDGKTLVCKDLPAPPVLKWYDMKSVRKDGVRYTNTLDHAIYVSAYNYSGPSKVRCVAFAEVDGLPVGYQFMNNNIGACMASIMFVVPPGSSYLVGRGEWDVIPYAWFELR